MNLATVRCSGCAAKIGVSEALTPLRNKVWCSALCHAQPSVGVHETRDAVMAELSRQGRPDGAIGELFGVGRSRVQQVVAARRL